MLRLVMAGIVIGSLLCRSAELFVTLRGFADGPGEWRLNSKMGDKSKSRVLADRRQGDPCVRLEAVFQSAWEAFKTPVPAGAIPAEHRALIFLARAQAGVRGFDVRLGLADGSWWRANAGVTAVDRRWATSLARVLGPASDTRTYAFGAMERAGSSAGSWTAASSHTLTCAATRA